MYPLFFLIVRVLEIGILCFNGDQEYLIHTSEAFQRSCLFSSAWFPPFHCTLGVPRQKNVSYAAVISLSLRQKFIYDPGIHI